MNKAVKYIVMGGALLWLAAGCGREDPESKLELVSFGVSTIETKAAWGDDYQGGSSTWQRINWQSSDRVRIVSDVAYNKDNNSQKWAEYTVTPKQAYERYYYGSLVSSSGLAWDSSRDRTAHNFWGVYPARDITDDRKITATMPADAFLMVSKASGQAESNQVSMDFYPAFTTVRLSIENADGEGLTVTGATLESGSNLQGTFTGRIKESGIADVLVSSGSSTANSTTGSVYIGNEGTGAVEFFLLPLDATLDRLTLNISDSIGASHSKSMTLSSLKIEACKQYRLKLRIDPLYELVFIDFEVLTMGQDFGGEVDYDNWTSGWNK